MNGGQQQREKKNKKKGSIYRDSNVTSAKRTYLRVSANWAAKLGTVNPRLLGSTYYSFNTLSYTAHTRNEYTTFFFLSRFISPHRAGTDAGTLAHGASRLFTRLRLSLVSHSVTLCSACDVVVCRCRSVAVVFVVSIHTVANSVWLAPSPNVHIIILLCAPYMHFSITFVPLFSFLGSFLLFFISVSTRYLLRLLVDYKSCVYAVAIHTLTCRGGGGDGRRSVVTEILLYITWLSSSQSQWQQQYHSHTKSTMKYKVFSFSRFVCVDPGVEYGWVRCSSECVTLD